MSQAGLIDIEASHPQIPTQFDTDDGSAIPVANVLILDGETVANATNVKPLYTTGSGNTVTANIQVGAAITGAPGDKNDAGIVSFDDTMFSVDANGYVQLAGGSIGLDSLTGDDSTVVTGDASGNINVVGSTVANATNVKPLYISGDAGTNTITAELQVGAAITGAPADSNDAGVVSLDDDYFTCSEFGFVSAKQAIIDTAMANIIVDPNGTKAEYTSMASAIAAASSNDTIGIKRGTYTENITIDKNLNFFALGGETRDGVATLNAVLEGKITFSGNYNVRIQGIHHKTNGDNLIDFNGNNGNLWYDNCGIGVATGLTGFNLDGSGGNVSVFHSKIDGAGTSKLFDISGSSGNIWLDHNFFEGFTTASTLSAGGVNAYFNHGFTPINASGGTVNLRSCYSSSGNNTVFTSSGSGSHTIYNCNLNSGSAVCISIGASTTVTCTRTTILSTNGTAAIDGAGTINYGGLVFAGTSSAITTTTQTVVNEGPSRTISSNNIGGTNTFKVENSNNTNVLSHAKFSIDSGGTSGGDPFVRFNVPSGQDYSFGIDNSDSDKLKITDDADPSTGNALFTITPTGTTIYPFLAVDNIKIDGNTIITTDTNGNLNLTPDGGGIISHSKARVGGNVGIQNYNTDNTNASSDAYLQLLTGGSSGGDPYLSVGVASTQSFCFGVDNSASDSLKINTAVGSLVTPSSGTNVFTITVSGDADFPAGTGYLGLPTGTTAQQPGSPAEGMFRGNTSNSYPEYYDGASWVPQVQGQNTWTPVLEFGGGSTGITYSSQVGRYFILGEAVYMFCQIVLTSKGTDTGNATITGLPFVATQTTPFAYRVQNLVFITTPIFRLTTSTINCEEVATGAALTTLTDVDFADTTLIQLSGIFLR